MIESVKKSELTELSDKQLKQYGLMMGAVISGLFGILVPVILSRPYRPWPWVLAVSFWVMALLFPNGLRGVHAVWMRFGHVMGRINTTLLLSGFYFLLFVPIACILKLSGRDRLHRDWKQNKDSYRVIRDREQEPSQMERPF